MLSSTAEIGQERTYKAHLDRCLRNTMKAQAMTHESRSPDGKHSARWYVAGELWMSGPEWGVLELDDSEPFRFALSEFKWSADSAYFAFVFIHDEQVTTRQGIEGLSFKIRIVRLCDGQVRHLTGSRHLAPVTLTEFDGHRLVFRSGDQSHTVILDQLNWTKPNTS